MSEIIVDFQEVDVFTTQPFSGNPVAVIFAGDRFSTEQMQKIANWIHLSETTFVCKPTNDGADYRLRIFSPQNELPFAGHPTFGSAQAVLNEGLIPTHKGYIVQECEKGLIKIYIKIAEKVDVGAVWYTLEIKNAKQVLQLTPDMSKLSKTIPSGVTGITIFGKYSDSASSSNFEVRSFAPNEDADEDPVCGSGNGCVAVLVKKFALVNQEKYSVSQGSCLY